jgi:4-carboxymuconolactone decarboxylase
LGAALLIVSGVTAPARQAGVSNGGRESELTASGAIAKDAGPKDVDQQSGFRLPLPKRDDMDNLGKKLYDQYATPNPQSLAGLRGPAGIRLYSPLEAQHESEHNHYLRFDAGFNPRIRELAILVSAREADSQFEWAAHEPAARKEGLDPKIIDIVKYRKSPAGLPETEAVIIQLGREMFDKKKVSSETFARALKIFGPRGMVNMVALMGDYCATAALLTAFDMQLPPGEKPQLPPR